MKKIILSNEQIVDICKRLASELEERFANTDSVPVFVGVVKGALPFMFELIKHYTKPMYIDFVQVSSYQNQESTGTIVLKKDVTTPLKDRDVVIIEDIVDTGFTMNYLVKFLKEHYNPNSITTVALLDKKCKRKLPFELDHFGMEVGDEFVVGFGFDYDELERNTPYIFVPDEKQIETWNKLNKDNN